MHISDAQYLNSEEKNKTHLMMVKSWKFKSALAANKFMNILVYAPDYL